MKFLKVDKDHYGKLLLIGATLVIWSVILVLFKQYGYRETWELWKVPTAEDVFLDFQLIPGSAESFRNGFEPTVENPADPAGRIFNYPAFWRLFFYTGITLADTIWIGICMNLLFFLGAFLFPKRLSIPGAIGMLLVLFSPASMLLYERGNVDLIVFFLCAMIVVAQSYSPYLTAVLIAFASIVKLFPFFGVSVLLKETKNKFWLLFAGCFIVLFIYMVAASNSVHAAWSLTMRGDDKSYGTNVFITRFGVAATNILGKWLSPELVELLLKYGPLASALILLFVVAVIALRSTQQPGILSERNFAAFRMGASIYVGTFLLGNNWDYRLAFLVFVVPQLVDWLRSPDRRTRFMAYFCMAATLISCWHFLAWYPALASENEVWIKTVFIFDESVNWLLMAGLTYLLLVTSPDWLKEPFRNLLPKGRMASSTS